MIRLLYNGFYLISAYFISGLYCIIELTHDRMSNIRPTPRMPKSATTRATATTKCRVELTPEHCNNGGRSSTSSSTSSPPVSKFPKSSSRSHHRESELDIIERFSDIKLCKDQVPLPPPPSNSLGILLRERLGNEGIRLSAPPFTSKVRKERKS